MEKKCDRKTDFLILGLRFDFNYVVENRLLIDLNPASNGWL